MAFVAGCKSVTLLSGVDVSPFTSDAELSRTLDAAEVTNFGSDCTREYIPGVKDGAITLNGFWDGSAGANDSLYTTVLGTNNRVFMYYPGGAAFGSAGYGVDVLPNEDVITSDIGSAVAQNLTAQANAVDRVLSLQDPATVETAAGNSASIDNGASTTNGAVFYLSVPALTGTNIDVVIEDSPDDAVWTPIGTFTSVVAAPAAERITVAGTVDRYLRVAWTGTFTGAQFNAGARRL